MRSPTLHADLFQSPRLQDAEGKRGHSGTQSSQIPPVEPDSERQSGTVGQTGEGIPGGSRPGAVVNGSQTPVDHGRNSCRRECGHPADDGSGRVCRRICAPGRDYHGGGHWYADPDLDGDFVRHSTARWIVTGETA